MVLVSRAVTRHVQQGLGLDKERIQRQGQGASRSRARKKGVDDNPAGQKLNLVLNKLADLGDHTGLHCSLEARQALFTA